MSTSKYIGDEEKINERFCKKLNFSSNSIFHLRVTKQKKYLYFEPFCGTVLFVAFKAV